MNTPSNKPFFVITEPLHFGAADFKTTIMEIMKFEFNEQVVEFDPSQTNIMVNATQMAVIFDKKISHFMANEATKLFIEACLKSRNSGFLGIEKESDLYTSKQKSGTWMHRVLALKFAAWLDPNFELWVYMTIDQLLFGNSRQYEESLRESAARKKRINQIKNQLYATEGFLELEKLELQERQAAYLRTKSGKQQISFFQSALELDFS